MAVSWRNLKTHFFKDLNDFPVLFKLKYIPSGKINFEVYNFNKWKTCLSILCQQIEFFRKSCLCLWFLWTRSASQSSNKLQWSFDQASQVDRFSQVDQVGQGSQSRQSVKAISQVSQSIGQSISHDIWSISFHHKLVNND